MQWLPSILSALAAIAGIYEPQLQHWLAAHPQALTAVAGMVAVGMHLAPSPIKK